MTSASPLPAPPSPFHSVSRKILKSGSTLHRVHDAAFEANSFNPCRGRPTRFAPLHRPDGSCIPTAYAASTFECSVHETVFHEVQHDASHKSVAFGAIENLDYSILKPKRDLIIATLFEPDLNSWGKSRRDLIDTFATAYVNTAKWALAIHETHADVQGLTWTSRRCDPEQAYILFGDRVQAADLDIESRRSIAKTNSLLAQLRQFAARANIVLTF